MSQYPIPTSSTLGDALSFIKREKKHFLTLFFKYSWWIIILALFSNYCANILKERVTPAIMKFAEDNPSFNPAQGLDGLPVTDLLSLAAITTGTLVLSIFIALFTPVYFLLYNEYHNRFGFRDFTKTFFSRVGHFVIFFLSLILAGIIALIPFSVIMMVIAQFQFIFMMFMPIVLGMAVLWVFMSLNDFISYRSPVLDSFRQGYKIVFNNFRSVTANFIFLYIITTLISTFAQQLTQLAFVKLVGEQYTATHMEIYAGVQALIQTLFMIIMVFLHIYACIGFYKTNATTPLEENNSDQDNPADDPPQE